MYLVKKVTFHYFTQVRLDLNAEFILVICANVFYPLFELCELYVCYQEMASISM